MSDKCTWSDDRDGSWFSDCRQVFIFTEEGPIGNGFAFCPFCGKPIAEDQMEDDDIEEDDPLNEDEGFCESCGAWIADGLCAICTDPGMGGKP